MRIDDDMSRICRSATIPSLKSVGSAYGLACGDAGPARPQPGRPRAADVVGRSVALASALMTDDSTQMAEAAATTIRAIVPPPKGDETGLRAWVTGEVGFEADRSEAVKSDRRDAAARHLRAC